MTAHNRLTVILLLGTTQTLGWASSFYLPAILGDRIAEDLGVSSTWFFAAFSGALVVSVLVAPRVGRTVDAVGGREVLVASNLILATGLAVLAFAHSPAMLWLARLILGLGMQREPKPEAELSDGRDRSVRTGDHLGTVVAAMPPCGSEPAAQPSPGTAIPGHRFWYDRGRVFLQLSSALRARGCVNDGSRRRLALQPQAATDSKPSTLQWPRTSRRTNPSVEHLVADICCARANSLGWPWTRQHLHSAGPTVGKSQG